MNTEKTATVMAEALSARLVKVRDAQRTRLQTATSSALPRASMEETRQRAASVGRTYACTDEGRFHFSTAGNFNDVNHTALKELLVRKGCHIVGEFACL
ncbi:MAG: hypothetical protein ACXVI8_05135 [Halobacteriota archaeon]